jgi:hypothetical protein
LPSRVARGRAPGRRRPAIALDGHRWRRAEAALSKVAQQIEHVQGADERIRTLIETRRKAYAGIFEAIVEERGL